MLQIRAGKMDFCALNDLEMMRNKQIDRNFVQKLHACEGSTCRNPQLASHLPFVGEGTY